MSSNAQRHYWAKKRAGGDVSGLAKSMSFMENFTGQEGTRSEFSGKVSRLFCQKDNFSAGILFGTIDNSDLTYNVKFSAPFPMTEGQVILATGLWAYGKKRDFGVQFQVEHLGSVATMDEATLVRWIANQDSLVGLGPARAKQLVETYGQGLWDALSDPVAVAAKIKGVSAHVLAELKVLYEHDKITIGVECRLISMGLSPTQARKVITELGANAIDLINSNPYLLSRHVDGYGFVRCDKLAQERGIPMDSPHRLRAALEHGATCALDEGHCWTFEDELTTQSLQALQPTDVQLEQGMRPLEFDAELIQDCYQAAEDDAYMIRMQLPDPDRPGLHTAWALRRIYAAETEFFTLVSARGTGAKSKDEVVHALQITARPNAKLWDEQMAGAVRALTSGFSIITGGAGCGKTFTIAAICRAAQHLGMRIALAAPTGKAAKRIMEQLTAEGLRNLEAKTLHRLLEFKHGQFGARVTADLLIVDETSMMDSWLAAGLMRQTDAHTCVLFVGDYNQLPPVGAGMPFRDMVEKQSVPVTRLEHVHRQAGVLKVCSCDVLQGKVAPTSGEILEDAGYAPWTNILLEDSTDDAANQLFDGGLLEEIIFNSPGLDPSSDVQILSPQRKGQLGVNEMNLKLQAIFQRRAGVDDATISDAQRVHLMMQNDKIMQCKNNYQLDVMNGTVGAYLRLLTQQEQQHWLAAYQEALAERKRRKMLNPDLYANQPDPDERPELPRHLVEFEARKLRVTDGQMREMRLAYAMTIHKSQGSEFKKVLVICHKAHNFMHHRNLLYTAVTRSQRCTILLGDSWGLKNCASKQQVISRRTILSQLLNGVKL